jgi:high-affinity iron transporter
MTAPQLSTARRAAPWALLVALLGALVWITTQSLGVDPTETTAAESHATVVVDSAIIVFREGLEAVLIFAAVTASFLGANRAKRPPVVAGAGVGFAAAVGTWFVAQAILGFFSGQGPKLEAITGLLAVVVLLVIMNWFLHNIYWTAYIKKHHARRRKLLAGGTAATLGLVMLGFTSVYREGFEVVLFLQNLQLKAGTAAVVQGVGIGLTGTAAVGVLTFVLQRRLPYRRMLVVTGVMIGFVLVVMIGGTAATFQDLGWLPSHSLGVAIPDWAGRWFEVYPTVETIAAQVLAVVFVVGSYFLAEHLKVRRPRKRGERAAVRADAPPAHAAPSLGGYAPQT